jgi:hypothetical protein
MWGTARERLMAGYTRGVKSDVGQQGVVGQARNDRRPAAAAGLAHQRGFEHVRVEVALESRGVAVQLAHKNVEQAGEVRAGMGVLEDKSMERMATDDKRGDDTCGVIHVGGYEEKGETHLYPALLHEGIHVQRASCSEHQPSSRGVSHTNLRDAQGGSH